MAVMQKLKIFVVQEPVVAASCLIAGFGEFSSSLSFNLINHPFLRIIEASPSACFKRCGCWCDW
ncbi:hypothetical protein ES319_D11G107800v1 [Gossypium barbadense]|uniref:Uncharacterized protein n=1 Tax=Gossypium barbadense TaxID=3634 RepID=A0A5J5PBP7_GOSBA|nr:hypothetical protein ES319_D11G107800v1 [Gossypium barbadense]